MPEASRQRYLFLKNRLEELLARHGPPPEVPPDGADLEPSWGPLGSLAARLMTEQALEQLLRLDRERGTVHALHRPSGRQAPQQAIEQQDVQNRVLEASTAMTRLDEHGETPLFGCPRCGEESAKASVPLDLWHCTACGTSGRASYLPSDQGPKGPGW